MGFGIGNVVSQATGDPLTTGATGGLSAVWKGSGIGDAASKAVGMDMSKQQDLADQSGQMSQQEYGKMQEQLGNMTQAEKDYQSARDQTLNPYKGQLADLQKQATDQATSAQQTYNTSIQPRLQSAMEDAQKNAQGAMTLQQASDPNNSVASAYRNMYEQQAVGEGARGRADAGVLSSLGAQSMANQFSGMPGFTGANFQLAQSGAMSQAGQAYNQAQQRMQSLRDQGLATGINQSNMMYQQGQNAQNTYANRIQGLQQGIGQNYNQQAAMRGEQLGYGSQYANTNLGAERENLGFGTGQANRQMGAIGQYYGQQQQGIANQVAMANAQNAQKAGIFSGILGAAGSIGGAMAGGPAGASAGGAAGKDIAPPPGIANYAAPPPQQYGQYGGYQQKQGSYA